MKRTLHFLAVIFILCSCEMEKETTMDLSGDWKFQIDEHDKGISDLWYLNDLADELILPGSMAENDKGDEVSVNTRWTGKIADSSWFNDEKYKRYRKAGNIKIPFWLQPEKHYLGPAWYQKVVNVPGNWENQSIELILERPHWQTRVWVDDQLTGMENSLGTPHVYNLTSFLKPGKHVITIRVDNRINEIDPGINSHSISDHTQSNWNGITGNISLRASSPVMVDQVQLYPDVLKKEVLARIWCKNLSGKPQDCRLILEPVLANNKKNETISSKSIEFTIVEEEYVELVCPMGASPLLWDEFDPNLYEMNLELLSPSGVDKKQVSFGMREFKAEGSRFAINGRPVFLRGTLECAIFPLTGYPPTNVEAWKRIMEVIKNHGLNHIRFHSWCPPEAAFFAADEAGVYLQVECSSWANNGSSIGDGKPIDKWLYEEANHILDAYGNHPSFCLMAYGNEPAGKNQVEYLSDFVSYLKKSDSRHVYTGGAGWPYVEEAHYLNNPEPRIQGWGQGLNSIINKYPPETAFDFRGIIEETKKPYVSHEIGQWCVYPNFKEIAKYTGPLKARNFEIFQETLKENNMLPLADSFVLASGKLQALCYKADIEAALRTPGMAGFQLLDLHDFPGQGTALVGVLDAFWEEKGYITPDQYSKFSSETVPLARMKKRVFSNQEEFIAELEVAHFGNQPLKSPKVSWEISTREGIIISRDDLEIAFLHIDNCQELGLIKWPLNAINEATKLHLELSVNAFSNGWDFWVYPPCPDDINAEELYITDEPDTLMFKVLEEGGKVLWTLKKESLSKDFGGDIQVGFSSIFWNTAWTGGQAPHTLGILCNPGHEALAEFPTEYHSNWQWWDAMSHGQAIILDKLNSQIIPIVRIIDDWFENRSLGLIFEAKVGKGEILVSGIDLLSNQDERLEAQQLLYSLKKYMSSGNFHPEYSLTMEELNQLVLKPY